MSEVAMSTSFETSKSQAVAIEHRLEHLLCHAPTENAIRFPLQLYVDGYSSQVAGRCPQTRSRQLGIAMKTAFERCGQSLLVVASPRLGGFGSSG